MNENELKWDKLLHIKTTGRDDSRSDTYRYPYEPTPYCVLERLSQSGMIGRDNTLLDYGCGKGRVGFYLSYQTRCHSIGIEYDERLVRKAMENHLEAAAAGLTQFVLTNAENYKIPPRADRLYFFNPFSVEILRAVVERIRESYYEVPRQILLYFYYPSDEYIAYLMTVEELEFLDEISCEDLFEGNNPRERIVIFGAG